MLLLWCKHKVLIKLTPLSYITHSRDPSYHSKSNPQNKIMTKTREIRIMWAFLTTVNKSIGENIKSITSKSKIRNTKVNIKYRRDNGTRERECCSKPHS